MGFIKSMLVGAALSLSLLPVAARADGLWEPYPSEQGRKGSHHGRKDGRYEQRTVQQWVEGRYQQVWVPEQCFQTERQRGFWKQPVTSCVPAHYESKWVPGHYEQVTRWVWVPHGRGHGRRHGRR